MLNMEPKEKEEPEAEVKVKAEQETEANAEAKDEQEAKADDKIKELEDTIERLKQKVERIEREREQRDEDENSSYFSDGNDDIRYSDEDEEDSSYYSDGNDDIRYSDEDEDEDDAQEETVRTTPAPIVVKSPSDFQLQITKTESVETPSGEPGEPPSGEIVLFEIKSSHMDLYKNLFHPQYFKQLHIINVQPLTPCSLNTADEFGGLNGQRCKSIGIDMVDSHPSMSGGGSETFPYNIFSYWLDILFRRDRSLEEKIETDDSLLNVKNMEERTTKSFDHIETDRLPLIKPLPPISSSTATSRATDTYPTAIDADAETSTSSEPTNTLKIKLYKKGPVLTEKEYNEMKRNQTTPDRLEHDENGKTMQELIREKNMGEIQTELKRMYLSVYPSDVLLKLKEAEERNTSNKVWFVCSPDKDDLDEDKPCVYTRIDFSLIGEPTVPL